MKTKEELQKQLDDIQVQLNELKETKEWPKPREDFYCLAVNGIIKIRHSEGYVIKDIMDRGWYKTKADAEWADGVRMANTYLRGCNDGHEFVVGKHNYYPYFDTYANEFKTGYTVNFFYWDNIYFKSSEASYKAVNNIPVRLQKYLMPRPLDE